jgi:hypothetical protein
MRTLLVPLQACSSSTADPHLVDDEPLIRLDVRLVLEEAGYEVIEAFSADEALRLLGLGGLPRNR